MLKYETDFYILEFKEENEEIEEVIESLNNNCERIMSFFYISKIHKKVRIISWDSLEDFRIYFNKLGYNLPLFTVGISSTVSNEKRIDYVILSERKKGANHANDTIENLKKMIVHEFVHACHRVYNNGSINALRYIVEGLAAVLSDQYKNSENNYSKLTCNLKDLLENKQIKYDQYYIIMRYVFNTYSHEYILKLASDIEFAKKETPKIYQETNEWLNMKDTTLKM